MVFGKVASCLAFQFTWNDLFALPFFCEQREEKLHFLFHKKKSFSVSEFKFIPKCCLFIRFFRSKCNLSLLSRVHLSSLHRNKKKVCWKERWKRVEGRMSTTINYARTAAKFFCLFFGRKEPSLHFSCGAAPVNMLSKRNTWKVE